MEKISPLRLIYSCYRRPTEGSAITQTTASFMPTTETTTGSDAHDDNSTQPQAPQNRGACKVGCRHCQEQGRAYNLLLWHPKRSTMSAPRERSAFGKFWRSAILGVADGIPVVSQIVTFAEHMKRKDTPPAGPRLVVGWSTVVIMGMLMAAKMWGNFSLEELIRLVRFLIG